MVGVWVVGFGVDGIVCRGKCIDKREEKKRWDMEGQEGKGVSIKVRV